MTQTADSNSKGSASTGGASPVPSIALPKGGGAIRGIGEKFAANPVTGTGSFSVPIATSPARSGFGPQLSLTYDSGNGNGPFGLGWNLSLPSVTIRTDRGLPRYNDAEGPDVFIISGAEDLVPVYKKNAQGEWERDAKGDFVIDEEVREGYTIRLYRPRTEGLFARVERWTRLSDGDVHWRSISKENITTLYGKSLESRIADPNDSRRVFSWLICESYNDKGNALLYSYVPESVQNIDLTQAGERNRLRTAGRYLKRIQYGNRVSRLLQPDLTLAEWMFEVVFDYDEGHFEELALDPALPEAEQHRFVRASAAPANSWAARPDPFSSHRPAFEVRTYRRCRRAMLFHRFPELGGGPYLVRSTEFNYADLDYAQPTTVEAELAYRGSTRFASFIGAVTQSGYVRDDTRPAVVRNGVTFTTYLKNSLPPLEFEYSKAIIQDDVRELDAESLGNMPAGLDGATYQWVDLDGEGVSGILTEQADAWFYKPNLGGGRFGPLEKVASRPSLAALSGGRQQLLDLAGDGQLDLVAFGGPTPGFFERTDDRDWGPFRTFAQLPNVPWDEPNLRFVDLSGDGHADVLITEDEVFTWHESLAEEGFGAARRVLRPPDEERGPQLVLADGTQSVYLADMSGDGLTDLLRIRNGEVCYWPNQGYGRFGAKVTMDNAPWFDNPDQFNQRHIRLADIDGSGASDIIYLGRDGVRLYFNQSGNRWSEARRLNTFPHTDNLSAVMTTDLLGNGTACLVWSSPLPGDAGSPLRYVDLMGGQKPHLLTGSVNNLGAETRVRYAPSTKFYLADKLEGKPWITRLPFPVHVVERVETFDRVSGNRFVSTYAYHHGHFDGVEREFQGFGLVEQRDTEEFAALNAAQGFPVGTNVEESSHVPPVLTRAWFHNGVYLGRENVPDFFAGLVDANDAGEYYREPGLTDAQARQLLLADTPLPGGLTVEEEREACRALKGSMLRQEVYALDGTAKEKTPYTVTEQNFTVRLLQPKAGNPHAVFFTHARESISYHYERDPADPRVGHALTLEVDEFGGVLKSAAVGYGRRQPDASLPSQADRDKQTTPLVTYTENSFTNPVAENDAHRAPLPCESRTYELTGYTPSGAAGRFQMSDFVRPGPGGGLTHIFDGEVPYEAKPGGGKMRRLIEQVRTYYRPDDLGSALNDPLALLPFGELESLALTGETYKLAFTPGLLTQVFQRPRAGLPAENLLPDPAGVLPADVPGGQVADRGGYVDLDADDRWWIPSERVFHSPNAGDSPAAELNRARQQFFLPQRYRDPFGQTTTVVYDVHDLLILETRDPLGNLTTAGERDQAGVLTVQGNDYRVLQPRLAMDANRNRSAVAFDALGMVAGAAVMGKPEENPAPGDRLAATFRADLTRAEIDQFLANPKGPSATALLGDATRRIVYDLTAYLREPAPQKKPPVFAATLARETHAGDAPPPGGSKIQVSFSYSDGFGREIQKKIQAEPGPVPQRDPVTGRIVVVNGQPSMTPNDVSPRWVGSGWTVFNNKGKPVRQYEPFFTDTHGFEFDVRIGVSPVLCYDPVGRVVATLHPDHTYEKVVFDPWRQETWDASDTGLLADPGNDPDVGNFFDRLPVADYLPTWQTQRQGGALGPQEQDAARKAAVHAATPALSHFDTLGRAFLAVAHNKFKYSDTPAAAPPAEEFLNTRTVLDVEGNEREVVDAEGRVVVRYDYDMLSRRIHQASMEAGERWMLNDVAGKPLYAWDSRARQFGTAYDAARRPTDSLLREGAAAPVLVGRTVYGEGRPNPEADNLRGRVFQVFDQAGVVFSHEYDFKGNLLRSERALARSYDTTLNWSAAVPLEAVTYTARTSYDALDRPTRLTGPDNTVIRPGYNEANLLERVDANLRGAQQNGQPVWTPFVSDIDYDAKGQRTLIDYGNGVRTTYSYDPLTFRLVRLLTRRNAAAFPDDCPQPPPAGWPGCQVQNLSYTYDPAGNITGIRDDAQQTLYFRKRRVEPNADYTYDAIYRLIEATGREHLGQVGAAPSPGSYNDRPRVGILLSASDGNAVGRYLQRYVYDAVGNFQQMIHRGSDPVNPGWTRAYAYNEPSLLEPARQSNRLTSTTIGATTESYSIAGNGYDAHGNMLRMPQLQVMQWDYKDQLQMTRRQAVNAADDDGVQRQGERTWYVYDAGGQRVRKVTESAPGQVKDERIYLGSFEVYRRRGANPLSRETLHVMDDKQRIALVETRTQGNEPGVPLQLIRYQLGNHLGSASLELDDRAQIISYEEYTPYGSTSYQAVRSQTEVLKRYRYTGKERDEESGLYYHRARYYAPWLAWWISADPVGIADGTNMYPYSLNNPIRFSDPGGTQATPHPREEEAQASLPEVHGTAREEERQASIPAEHPPTAGTAQPSRAAAPTSASPGGVISPPPPVSGTDYKLYVPPGIIWRQYESAFRETFNSDNPAWARVTFGVLTLASAPLAGAEEYVGRSLANIPFLVHNAGTGIGEHGARAYLWQQQGETGEAVVESLEATVHASAGFLTLASVAEPFTSRVPSGPAAASSESRTVAGTANESAVVEGSGSAPAVAPNRSTVALPNAGENAMAYGTRTHQELPRIIGETNPGAGGRFNVAPGLTGPDLANPTGMNASFAEMKSLWGRQGPMVTQARNWGFDAQAGRYFFYDRNTGMVFEGIIQTEKFASGAFRP